MAKRGAKIVSSDFSEVFIDLASARTAEGIDLIEYQVVDATDPDQLLAFGERRFDATVCTMAIFDMSAIEALVTSLAKLLNPSGRSVFLVIYPCFDSPNLTKVAEQADNAKGEVVTSYSVKVTDYITPFSGKGTACGASRRPTGTSIDR